MTKQIIIKLNKQNFKPLLDQLMEKSLSRSCSECAGKCIIRCILCSKRAEAGGIIFENPCIFSKPKNFVNLTKIYNQIVTSNDPLGTIDTYLVQKDI